MIEQLRLRGAAGSVIWGYRTVAELGSWAIIRDDSAKLAQVRRPSPTKKGQTAPKRKAGKSAPGWVLSARVQRHDSFQIRQKPLFFTAPRNGGFWYFPVLEPPVVDNRGVLRAKLGHPER